MSNFLFCAKIKNFCGARKFLEWDARNFTYKCKKEKNWEFAQKFVLKEKISHIQLKGKKREKGKIFQKRKLDPLV